MIFYLLDYHLSANVGLYNVLAYLHRLLSCTLLLTPLDHCHYRRHHRQCQRRYRCVGKCHFGLHLLVLWVCCYFYRVTGCHRICSIYNCLYLLHHNYDPFRDSLRASFTSRLIISRQLSSIRQSTSWLFSLRLLPISSFWASALDFKRFDLFE